MLQKLHPAVNTLSKLDWPKRFNKIISLKTMLFSMSSLRRYIQLEIRNNDTIITTMMNIHVEIHEHTWFWNTFADRLNVQ